MRNKGVESLVELLAPAGTKEAFYAAVENGANAVYLAGKMFGARAYAANFDEQELSDVIHYAHLKNVQVHVAVNTIIDNEELPKLKEYLSFLSSVGADAVLVQDLGAARLAQQIAPSSAACEYADDHSQQCRGKGSCSAWIFPRRSRTGIVHS